VGHLRRAEAAPFPSKGESGHYEAPRLWRCVSQKGYQGRSRICFSDISPRGSDRDLRRAGSQTHSSAHFHPVTGMQRQGILRGGAVQPEYPKKNEATNALNLTCARPCACAPTRPRNPLSVREHVDSNRSDFQLRSTGIRSIHQGRTAAGRGNADPDQGRAVCRLSAPCQRRLRYRPAHEPHCGQRRPSPLSSDRAAGVYRSCRFRDRLHGRQDRRSRPRRVHVPGGPTLSK